MNFYGRLTAICGGAVLTLYNHYVDSLWKHYGRLKALRTKGLLQPLESEFVDQLMDQVGGAKFELERELLRPRFGASPRTGRGFHRLSGSQAANE